MTIAVLIITIVALLFAVAAIVFFKLKAPTAGAIFAIACLVPHAGGCEGFSISQDGRFANDDAADNGVERGRERRRLGAHALGCRFDISGAGRDCLDGARRDRQ